MNQLKVQAPYLSKNPMIDHTLTSQSQPSLLSSSDYSKPVDIKQLARSGINPKGTEQLAFNIINQLQPDSPTDNFESLLSLGVSPNLQQSHDGKSFLMIAAERGLHKVFSKLLRLNAFVNLRDNQGKTALFYIIESKFHDLQILQELLQKDVDLNIRSRNGLTPIQTAIERGLVPVVDLLAKKRANPFIKFEATGDTALHVAARRRDKAMFKYLLDYGFDPKRRNKNRQTVKDVCKDQPELLDLLKDKFFSAEDGISDQRKGPQGAERSMQNDNRQSQEDPNFMKRKGEASKSNKYPQNFNRVRDENSESLNNTGPGPQEQKNLPMRNDDNYSNASTSYSNGHSEINFHTKHHNLTLTSHYSDDPSKYSDKPSGQFSNNLQVHNRQRENSGVSRTSITSAQSDMVSDNESMSAHSQSNLASNSYMQQFSPDMQEKSKNGGSVGDGYFSSNGPQNFNRDYSRSQSYMNTSGGDNSANGFNKQQKRNSHQSNNNNNKYKTQGSLKTAYTNGGSFNDYPSPNNTFNSNREEMNQMMNQHQYFNNRSPAENGKINLINNNGGNFMPPGVENRQQMMMNENGPGSPNMYPGGGMYHNYGGEMPGMMRNQPPPQFFFNPQHGYNNYMGMPPDFNNMTQIQENEQQREENHFTNQAQQENIGLRDKLSSTMKQSKEYQSELDSAKQENRQIKNQIEETNTSSKSLEQIFKEKEELIQELIRKNQSLEDSIKQVNPDFIYDGYHSKGCSTDNMLKDFVSASMEDLLFNEKLYRPFPKPETVAKMLDQEVREFERAVDRYSESKQPIYDKLQELIHVTLADLMPEAECTIYGSFATGLWLPWSDIDIVIKIPQIETALNILHLLESRLKEEDWISETKAIKNTTVPLLKVVCSEEFMKQKLDINIKDFRHNELSCVNMIKEYIALYPPLRPITLVIKDILNSNNLNNTYLGGLSSYGILLMVVYLLQTKEMEKSKNPIEEQNLGEMLLSFLHCFGLEYDYYTQYIVNPMKILTNGETPNEMMNIKLRNMIAQCQPSVQQPRIIIQDPISIQNNVGKSTFRIIEIKNALIAAYFEAYKPCTCEIHNYVEELEEGGEKKEHQCSSILRKMYVASQSGQIFQK